LSLGLLLRPGRVRCLDRLVAAAAGRAGDDDGVLREGGSRTEMLLTSDTLVALTAMLWVQGPVATRRLSSAANVLAGTRIPDPALVKHRLSAIIARSTGRLLTSLITIMPSAPDACSPARRR
jgi:hypothetical protein